MQQLNNASAYFPARVTNESQCIIKKNILRD